MSLSVTGGLQTWCLPEQEAKRRGRDLRSLSRYMRRHRCWHKRARCQYRLVMIEWATIDVGDMIR